MRYVQRDSAPVAWFKRHSAPVRVLLLFLAALAALPLGYAAGRMMDCSPGQQDGQCGLATFCGLLAGAGCGIFIFFGGIVAMIINGLDAQRRKRQENPYD